MKEFLLKKTKQQTIEFINWCFSILQLILDGKEMKGGKERDRDV